MIVSIDSMAGSQRAWEILVPVSHYYHRLVDGSWQVFNPNASCSCIEALCSIVKVCNAVGPKVDNVSRDWCNPCFSQHRFSRF